MSTVCLFICYWLSLFPETLAQLPFSPLYILFSELTHGNLRTEIVKLQSSHSVWASSSTGIRMSQALSSFGQIINLPPGGFSSVVFPCTHYGRLQFNNLGKSGSFTGTYLFFFQGFCTDDNSQGYTCKLKKNPT